MQREQSLQDADRAGLVVPAVGSLVATGQAGEPYRLLDPDGVSVGGVAEFFAELLARGRTAATLRSYGMDLLRWLRFLWAAGVVWDRASRAEARDFARWMRLTDRPARPHWRTGVVPDGPAPPAYSASVRAHSETVLRGFYEFHREAGSGPLVNPFPLVRQRGGRRIGAHTNPMDKPVDARRGLYRPVVASRVPRSVPDEEFNAIFARLPSHRDRALVAFYVSSGMRASELLSVTTDRVDPGRQVITVVRKGSGALAQVPASSDAFVWLRLYQVGLGRSVPTGRGQPLWWTLRPRPGR